MKEPDSSVAPRGLDSSGRSARIAILDPLRGVASFAVMWFHFTKNNRMLGGDDSLSQALRVSGKQGWLGVEVFFVISGFVLPYALWRGRYQISNYGQFLAKRLLRLEPPYIVALLLTVGLLLVGQFAPGFAGTGFKIEWGHFFLHFGYLNALFGYGWYNPVFWTLAIEFQFYLLIALVFPLALHRTLSIRLALPLGLAALAFLPVPDRFVFHYLALFALGLLTAQRHVGAISSSAFVVALAPITAAAFLTLDFLQASVGVAATLLIAALAKVSPESRTGRFFDWTPLAWLGAISYSLYLMHVPIGGRVVNLGTRLGVGPWIGLLVLALAVTVTLAASYGLYRLVERPSQQWSKSVSYQKKSARIEGYGDRSSKPPDGTWQGRSHA